MNATAPLLVVKWFLAGVCYVMGGVCIAADWLGYHAFRLAIKLQREIDAQ